MATQSHLPPPPSSPVNLWTILSESKRIINAHSRHFLALSVLFLLPLSFSITVYPSVFRLITNQSNNSHNSVSLLRGTAESDPTAATVTISLLIAFVILITVFNLLAIGSIAYSVFQGFYGRPVKLISAVKSSLASFLPLSATLISYNFVVLGILSILGFVVFLITNLISLSPKLYESYLYLILIIVSIVIVIKISVNWILSFIIVVVESSYGFTPLKRSKSLIKGMKSVSLSVILFFGVTESVLVWISSVTASAASDQLDYGKFWLNAFFVFQIVVTSAFLTVLMLYNLAAVTVMYMYCKAVHGELAWEIAEEFAREYVSLPFDDGKVPHLVSVAYNNNNI